MSMLALRDYQQEAEALCRAEYARGHRAVMLVMPTGAGKTVTFVSVAHQAAERGRRVLILVHRRELLDQTSRTLTTFSLKHGLITAGSTQFSGHPIQVASVQTIVRRMTKMRWQPDFIIVDECHHATGTTSWGKVLDQYPTAKVLGVTATPERLDGRGLGAHAGGFFNAMVIGPSAAELTERGYLSPAKVFAPTQQVDLSGVRSRAGDFAANELAVAMDKPTITGDAVAHYRRLCDGEPAIAFCASVAHAEHVAESFCAAGYAAASIDGSLDRMVRSRRIADLGTGKLQVLTSCDIISEGTDIPVVSAAILLRPTQSLALCLQQMGRAMRPFPGKTHATILDHVGNCFRHGLPADDRDWSLDGKPKKKGRKKEDEALPVRQCTQCYAIHTPAPTCPHCGFIYPVKARHVEEIDGELAEINKVLAQRQRNREQAHAQSLEDLICLAKARGYKNPHGWANHVWKGRQQKVAA